MGRLNHYCLTPLLFSPKWRFTVSPVRDHSIQMLNNIQEEDLLSEKQRSRHASSGYSSKKSDEMDIGFNRSRRMSGPAVSGSAPKTSPGRELAFRCLFALYSRIRTIFANFRLRCHSIEISSLNIIGA